MDITNSPTTDGSLAGATRRKVALITGITGQDGAYLSEFLLGKGYEVHGITRRASISNTGRIDHLKGRITLHEGDAARTLSAKVVRPVRIDAVASRP